MMKFLALGRGKYTVCSEFVPSGRFGRVECVGIFVAIVATCVSSITLLSGFCIIFVCTFSSWNIYVK